LLKGIINRGRRGKMDFLLEHEGIFCLFDVTKVCVNLIEVTVMSTLVTAHKEMT
jgi:hypothetical protein